MPVSYVDYQILRGVGAHLDRPQSDSSKDCAKVAKLLQEQLKIGGLSDFCLIMDRTLEAANLQGLVGREKDIRVVSVKPGDEPNVFVVRGEYGPKSRPRARVELEIERPTYDDFRGRFEYAVRDSGKVLLPKMARAR